MKHFLSFILISFFSLSVSQAKPWGLGLILFGPTGFSAKHRLTQKNSIDAALGYSIGDNIRIHGTYLWEYNKGLKIDDIYLGYYFGLGGALHSHDHDNDPPPWSNRREDDEFGLAVRGSSGLNYYFKDPHIEVFGEIALNFFFVPATDADLEIALGGRYFF